MLIVHYRKLTLKKSFVIVNILRIKTKFKVGIKKRGRCQV